MSSVDETPGNSFPPSHILAYPDVSLLVRRPTVLYTEGYDNDPTEFNTDERFLRDSITLQIEDMPDAVSRDMARFLKININDTADSEWHSIAMVSPIYNRRTVPIIFDGEFRELV